MNSKCKCTLAQAVLGDGCQVCNPKYSIENLEQSLSEVEEDYDTERRRADKLFDQLFRLRIAAKAVVDEVEPLCTAHCDLMYTLKKALDEN